MSEKQGIDLENEVISDLSVTCQGYLRHQGADIEANAIFERVLENEHYERGITRDTDLGDDSARIKKDMLIEAMSNVASYKLKIDRVDLPPHVAEHMGPILDHAGDGYERSDGTLDAGLFEKMIAGVEHVRHGPVDTLSKTNDKITTNEDAFREKAESSDMSDDEFETGLEELKHTRGALNRLVEENNSDITVNDIINENFNINVAKVQEIQAEAAKVNTPAGIYAKAKAETYNHDNMIDPSPITPYDGHLKQPVRESTVDDFKVFASIHDANKEMESQTVTPTTTDTITPIDNDNDGPIF